MSQDWKAQLAGLKKEMINAMPENERAKMESDAKKIQENATEIRKRKTFLYKFLAGYKQNSGIFINNFFRDRSYEMYCQDKFHSFDFDINGIIPNIFDDPAFSVYMIEYLSKLEDSGIAYYPVGVDYITCLIALSEVFDLLSPLEQDTVVYRGCSTLERNGLNGVISTTTDKIIAEQFSRGTILKIHLPAGTK